MRDIAFQERLKKLTERYTTELDHNREQFDLLKEEKMDMEHEYSERLKVLELSHQAEMQKRESLYQSGCFTATDYVKLAEVMTLHCIYTAFVSFQTRLWRRSTVSRSCSLKLKARKIARRRSTPASLKRMLRRLRCVWGGFAAVIRYAALPRTVALHCGRWFPPYSLPLLYLAC